jgi:hypothetical protein
MEAFSFDINDLDRKMTLEKPREINKVPYTQNKSKFCKVAFDMFRSNCDDTLWELVSENGEQFLIKRTDFNAQPRVESETQNTIKKGSWSVTYTKNEPVTLRLFDLPVRRFSSQQFGYTESTKTVFAQSVMDAITNNSRLGKDFVCALSGQDRDLLLARCENTASHQHSIVYSWLRKAF